MSEVSSATPNPPKPAGARRSLRPWISTLALVLVLAFMLRGLEQWAVDALIAAPNQGFVPPPGEVPGDAYPIRVERLGATIEAFVFEPVVDIRGTAVILHGLRDQKSSYLPTARLFAARGYRAVAVDLRGHGHSGGDYLTYGLLDADDVAAVLDALEGETELGPLALVGASYGGAVALRLAAQDPRVDAVATLETFATLRGILPGYARLILPFLPPPPEWFIDWTLSDAEALAHVDYALSDSLAAVRAIRAPILFVHGEEDQHIPIENGEALLSACWPASHQSGRCRLERRPGLNHLTLLSDGPTWTAVLDFLDASLGPNGSPSIE